MKIGYLSNIQVNVLSVSLPRNCKASDSLDIKSFYLLGDK